MMMIDKSRIHQSVLVVDTGTSLTTINSDNSDDGVDDTDGICTST